MQLHYYVKDAFEMVYIIAPRAGAISSHRRARGARVRVARAPRARRERAASAPRARRASIGASRGERGERTRGERTRAANADAISRGRRPRPR
jgi:hypothetical protein